MSPKEFFRRPILIILVASSLVFSGCSYIPWIGNDDEDDLAFEEDFPFEDQSAEEQGGGKASEDDFFSDDKSLIEGEDGGGFSSVDQKTDSKELQGDVENLQSQQEALISKVRELEEMIATLEPKVSATQERLEGSLSEVSSQSEFLEPEVEELKTQVAQLNEEIARLKIQRQGDLPKKVRGHARVGGTPPEYNKALDAYRKGNYDESILLFQNFALSDPPSNLKDNIAFWIGSNYLKLEMYDDAIKQFETVLNQYPRGNKIHDSRLMLGISYFKKGETSRAVDILQTALKYNPPAEVRGKIRAQLNSIQ
ncbi:MAG: tetratricopeptide repeat protein [Nitrospinaceae bacterium]